VAHTYNISDADLRSIVATFLWPFPAAAPGSWRSDSCYRIGGAGRGLWTKDHVRVGTSGVRPRPPEGRSRSLSVLTLSSHAAPDLQKYAAGALVQSDDRLAWILAPRAIYGRYQTTTWVACAPVAGGRRRRRRRRAASSATATDGAIARRCR